MVILFAEGTDEELVVIEVEEIGRLDVDDVLELSETAVEEVETEVEIEEEEEEGEEKEEEEAEDDVDVVVVLV